MNILQLTDVKSITNGSINSHIGNTIIKHRWYFAEKFIIVKYFYSLILV